MFDYENKYLNNGYKLIAGIDEAGRGPLAGPVCVAIVVMPLEKFKITETTSTTAIDYSTDIDW